MNRILHLFLYLITLFGIFGVFVYIGINYEDKLESMGVSPMVPFILGALGGFYISRYIFGQLIAAKCKTCGNNSAYIQVSSKSSGATSSRTVTKHVCMQCDSAEPK